MAGKRAMMILDSSMVEHTAVNRGVVGSSPTQGADRKIRDLLVNGYVLAFGFAGLVEQEIRIRLRGQAVKTSPFHGGNTGSIPVGVTKKWAIF